MATNVTEKDKALQEVIDWCEQREIEGLRACKRSSVAA